MREVYLTVLGKELVSVVHVKAAGAYVIGKESKEWETSLQKLSESGLDPD